MIVFWEQFWEKELQNFNFQLFPRLSTATTRALLSTHMFQQEKQIVEVFIYFNIYHVSRNSKLKVQDKPASYTIHYYTHIVGVGEEWEASKLWQTFGVYSNTTTNKVSRENSIKCIIIQVEWYLKMYNKMCTRWRGSFWSERACD